MLKWTVINKRDAATDTRRRSSVGICTIRCDDAGAATAKSTTKQKRRRSSTTRRSSASRRSTGRRNSLGLELDKENQYTSTPIKPTDEPFPADAFRDVSNLTPKEPRRSAKKSFCSPKKKKQCVDPSHSQDFLFSSDTSRFFRPFEAVDSHIEGLTSKELINCGCDVMLEEKPIPKLPTYTQRSDLILNHLKLNKKAKIDHVNDFLQQITYVTSPEELRIPRTNIKVSPLVKRFVDLRFSKISYSNGSSSPNDSSFINDLSLDKIVDAILDNSKENEMNETHEENLINAQNERLNSSYSDSGFRSTSTEQSHEIDVNFSCKCDVKTFDKTIINIEETFNERCVDVGNSRKRAADCPADDVGGKRMMTEDFTLKRQKGIRRRKMDDVVKKDDNDDNSYDSCGSEPGYGRNLTYVVDTPEGTGACRSRRCLSFSEDSSFGSSVKNNNREGCRGSMDLEVEYKEDELVISVAKCEGLRRSSGHPINAYVKVALSERFGDGRRKQKGTLQRTAVQADSCDPVFDHVFRMPLQKADTQKALYIEVWHRDRATRRSEFLGCVSFVIKNAIKKNIAGSYRLLPQSSGRCAAPLTIPITGGCAEGGSGGGGGGGEEAGAMCESRSSVEDVTAGLEEVDADLKRPTSKAALSQQQRDADENLFLRYLELDPTEGPDAAPAAAQRKAAGTKNNGRTPFTETKLLRRPPKTGFGFSVVWTHPPRIERVEKGLPADKAGMVPGDYLIFVDKHNVVMMPEIDILNLIRSYGNQLTLEIFRRSASRNGSVPSVRPLSCFETTSSTGLPAAPLSTTTTQRRPSTVCSTNTASVEYNRKKLHLPQVTFSSERPTNSAEEARKKAMYQIIAREQQYATALQFSMARFVSALAERKDLIGPAEHRVLFQNSDELLRITEDILDVLVQDDGDYQTYALLRTYHTKMHEITSAYKRYCSGIKKADCVLANAAKNQDFARFLQTPAIPRRRPDITVFIHKPLEHYRETLKLFNVILSHTKPNNEDYPVINQIVHELQVSYREMTSEAGLMEPMGEGRPLLSVQDLENRLVFTKCKPFVLAKPGRQWIFGGDLSRVEGRTVRPYWALLFSDILLFAKVSRDRVLFILEDPLPLAHVTDFFFNVRKKANEFRIIVEPGGKQAVSPTVHCGPDLSRTPRKNPTRRCVVLRTPTVELKAVWQNLLQRQIFHVNAGMDGSSYSSPLESPEAPITSSVVTLQSAESLSLRRQVRLSSGHCSEPVDFPCHAAPSFTQTSLLQHQSSLSKTPDTPSANISPSSSGHSQAFTSHFTSETSLLPRTPHLDEPPSPSAILTPTTDDTDAQISEDIDFLKFDEDPWDICSFEYEFGLNLDEYFKQQY